MSDEENDFLLDSGPKSGSESKENGGNSDFFHADETNESKNGFLSDDFEDSGSGQGKSNNFAQESSEKWNSASERNGVDKSDQWEPEEAPSAQQRLSESAGEGAGTSDLWRASESNDRPASDFEQRSASEKRQHSSDEKHDSSEKEKRDLSESNDWEKSDASQKEKRDLSESNDWEKSDASQKEKRNLSESNDWAKNESSTKEKRDLSESNDWEKSDASEKKRRDLSESNDWEKSDASEKRKRNLSESNDWEKSDASQKEKRDLSESNDWAKNESSEHGERRPSEDRERKGEDPVGREEEHENGTASGAEQEGVGDDRLRLLHELSEGDEPSEHEKSAQDKLSSSEKRSKSSSSNESRDAKRLPPDLEKEAQLLSTSEEMKSTESEHAKPPPNQQSNETKKPTENKQKKNESAKQNDKRTRVRQNDKGSTFMTANQKFAIVPQRNQSPSKTTQPAEPKVTEPRGPPPQRRPRKVKPEEEITGNSMRAKALRLERLEGYPIEDYDALVNEFQNERRRQIENRQFGLGDRINAAIEHVKKAKENQEKTNLQKEAIAKYQERKDAFDKELAEFDRETTRQIQELKDRQLESQQRLIDQQDREAEDNYIKWKMDAKMRQYNHASYHLVFQRKLLENLMQQGRFAEAEVVQKNIQRLEMQERESAYKVMQHDYNLSLKKLDEKHGNEMVFFQQNADVQMVKLKQKRAMERQRYINQKRKIDKRGEDAHDKERVWAAAQTQRVIAASKRRPETRDTKNRTAGSVTVRTQQTSTTIELPPLHLKKPVKRQVAATARP